MIDRYIDFAQCLYQGRFGLAVLSSTESSGFDVMKKMDQIDEANVGIAIATARPVKCVFNTMPQALFHRASIDDEEMVHFLPQKSRSKFEDRSAKIKRVGYRLNFCVVSVNLSFRV